MTPLIQTKNVTKTYKIGNDVIEAVKNVNISINKGEFVSIVGKSGSGKSTLMHLIGLLDTPTTGDILINGTNIVQMSEKELALIRNSEIGFVFQAYNLMQRANSLENVMLPLVYSKVPRSEWVSKARKMLELVELSDREKNKSNELSGGQKQRIAIARALVNDPSIILADEPTGNLDSKTGDEIISLFRKLNDIGKTVVIVTHDSDLADLAKRKIEIKDGQII